MKKILIQLDTDSHPSVFDRIVASDSGADEIFAYGGVAPADVEGLVHGGMFTRSPKKLRKTAVFVGGSDVERGQAIFEAVHKCFFGPLRLSVMTDCNGSNTTAAAAVLSAARHLDLRGAVALVLGGTGPVGQRIAELVARAGGHVRLASRDKDRAGAAAEAVSSLTGSTHVVGCEIQSSGGRAAALQGAQVIFAAGAAGVSFLDRSDWASLDGLKVAIDLNAVPPVGIEGIEVTDRAADHEDVICYGAVGVGKLKMEIHREAIKRLFESNDQVLDTRAIFELGGELVARE